MLFSVYCMAFGMPKVAYFPLQAKAKANRDNVDSS